MSKRFDQQSPIVHHLETRKRELESKLARSSNAQSRAQLLQQIREIEAARQMDGWLRSELRPPI